MDDALKELIAIGASVSAHCQPCAWVVNQSFANSASSDPLLAARARNEIPHIAEVAEKLSRRTVMDPWVPEEPVGLDRLGQFF